MAALVFSTITSIAHGAEGKWTEGYGQGNLEYFIDFSGKRLLISCPTQEGSADVMSSVTIYTILNNKEERQFTINAGGTSFDGPFNADSRASESNFHGLINALRKGDAVLKVGKQTYKLPISNAVKVLPAPGSKSFVCNTIFSN
ncbi:hypothetical protein [Undibacterium amnicola]